MLSRGTRLLRASTLTHWAAATIAIGGLVLGSATSAMAASGGVIAVVTQGSNVDEVPADEVPAEDVSADEVPVDEVPVGDGSADDVPVDEVPVDQADVEDTPADETVADDAAIDEAEADEPAADETRVNSFATPEGSLADFTPGNLISDYVFTNKSTMTEAQIQAFFNSKVRVCSRDSKGNLLLAENGKPYICIKDFTVDSVTRPADKYCSGYTGAKGESAARVIYRVSQACNINPQVLIVMLQKEQGLVTHTWPSMWRYDKALGQGCPDTAPCDPKYVGFFHQIYGAARQMQMYMEGRYFTWYAPGSTWNILYHPNKGCGTAPVPVKNAATSALYYYTPYQPNAAAMKAGYGTGDACSSYGNRNFYNYFTDWFGPTKTLPKKFDAVAVSVKGKSLVGQTLQAAATVSPTPSSTSYQWLRNGSAIKGATSARYTSARADVGASLSVRIVVKKAGFVDASATSKAVKIADIKVDRLDGPRRETTAVAVSKAAFPNGTKTLILATGSDFPDALSAAAAAGKVSAALLLTPTEKIPAAVVAEIKRLAPTRVILVGGEGVLSSAIVSQVRSATPKAKVERLAGADRYATSRATAVLGGPSADVLIATGRDFPDAVSAASAGNHAVIPVLLVDGSRSSLDAATIDTLRKLGAKSATIVGGDGVVHVAIEKKLKSLGLTVKRLAGANRYATNEAVAAHYFAGPNPKVLFASGLNFPDALTAAVLSGQWKAPMLLTKQSCVASTLAEMLQRNTTESVTLVGGPGVLGSGVVARKTC